MDEAQHKKHTGADNKLVLKNAPRISRISNTVIRVPVIPGFNFSIEAIKKIAEYARTLTNIRTIHLLPYHSFGANKYELMGRAYLMKHAKPLQPEELEECKAAVESYGFCCVIGG